MSFGERDLQERVDRLEVVNGELCTEINRQEHQIRELKANNSRLVAKNKALALDLAESESLRDEFYCKMSDLIGNLSNGKISKPLVENSVIEAVITEEFEALTDADRADLVCHIEVLKLYASKASGIIKALYAMAMRLVDAMPEGQALTTGAESLKEFRKELEELGIEAD